MSSDSDRLFVPLIGHNLQRFAVAIVVLVLTVLWVHGVRNGQWDWLLISGWAALLLGLWCAHGIPEKLEIMLDRLMNRQVLVVNPEQLSEFKNALEDRKVQKWALWGGAFVALAILVAFLITFSKDGLYLRIPLTLAEILAGYITGCYLGRMACYGFLGRYLGNSHIGLRMMLGHPDSVGGLKLIGDFYFYQAMVVAIPAIFLAIWLLIPMPYFKQFNGHWQQVYVGLFAVAITFEVLAFVFPLWSFHREMVRQKCLLWRDADRLAPEIAEIRRKLAQNPSVEELQFLRDSLEDKVARYFAIERMPEWPIDTRTLRLFSLNNLVLLIPLISHYTGLSTELTDFLARILNTA